MCILKFFPELLHMLAKFSFEIVLFDNEALDFKYQQRKNISFPKSLFRHVSNLNFLLFGNYAYLPKIRTVLLLLYKT